MPPGGLTHLLVGGSGHFLPCVQFVPGVHELRLQRQNPLLCKRVGLAQKMVLHLERLRLSSQLRAVPFPVAALSGEFVVFGAER